MKIVQETFKRVVELFFDIFFSLFPQKKISSKLRETINLYKGEGFGEAFAKIRIWDAPYESIDRIVNKKALVLDLGCGDGTLSNYLALSSAKRMIYGIDINKNRIKEADRGLKNTVFQQGDITKIKLIKPDVLILAHVLHHLKSKEAQIKFLQKISNNLKKGSELIILEIDNRPLLKYVFTWVTDAVTVPILFERKLFDLKFFYRESGEWKKILTGLGFDVKLRHVHKGMPFSHILIYGKKIA